MRISRDTPCLFITAVAKDRLPVFRTDKLAGVACAALNEARTSGKFAVFAYVIMPDHFHVLTDNRVPPSKVLQFIKGIISHRVIGHLKTHNHHASLEKLRIQPRGSGHEFSLWQHHSNSLPIISEAVFMQKVNYIHMNPVREGLVERAEDYRWSSVRCWWKKTFLEDEPFLVDIDQLEWRVG